jgi:predicted  nucleic acid-binding Zn-ribbon protein
MSGPAPILREVHRLRRFAHELQEGIDRFPRQLKAQQAKLARQEEAQREGVEALKRLKVTVHQNEGLLKSTHGQIAKYERQLNEAASKKEYDALQGEIAAARAKCKQLEDDILAGMDEVETRTAGLPELERATQQAREELARWEETARVRLAEQQAQLKETQTRLAEVEATLPANVREQYRRIITAMGQEGLSAVRSNTCAACGTEITAQNYNDLLAGNFFVCKSCGRILYLPE